MARYTEVTNYKDMPKLFQECQEPYWQRIAKALYYTAARSGELIKIQSQHIIQAENGNIDIKILTEKNKHAPIRYIPLLKSETESFEIFTPTPNPEDLCFSCYKPTLATTSYLRIMRKKFNEFWPGIAPHYFRHCRLTHMVTEFDFNDQELVRYAGWTDSKPAKWYMSLKSTDLRRKMELKI